MKDKLVKLNKKRVDVIDVILKCDAEDRFYFWIKIHKVLSEGKTFSLKKLARSFLADNPTLYRKYDEIKANLAEEIRIAKTPWLDED